MTDWRQSPAHVASAGVAAGVIVTLFIVLLIWPDSTSSEAGAGGAGKVKTPDVPPPPDQTDILTSAPPTSSVPDPAESSDGESDDEDDEDDDSGTEPEEAPVLANAAPAGQGQLPDYAAVTCPAATTTVSSADELEDALSAAQPGDSIEVADGTYQGNFATTVSGTATDPIFLCGTSDAVIDGGDIDGDYAFHLDGAQYWRLVGFSVQNGQKSVVADGTVGSVIQGLTISGPGDEAIHLRTHSTDNVVLNNTISDTGNRNDKYGEGVYLGSAVSNWCTYTDCEADRSDRNVVAGNNIRSTSSESVDIKEGTTGGLVVGNTFDGAGMTGADSWVDVKGNNYLIQGNVGVNAEENGMQTHQILDGWGDFNVFAGNSLDVGTSDYAIASWPEESNVVKCDNTFSNAAEGLSNIECS